MKGRSVDRPLAGQRHGFPRNTVRFYRNNGFRATLQHNAIFSSRKSSFSAVASKLNESAFQAILIGPGVTTAGSSSLVRAHRGHASQAWDIGGLGATSTTRSHTFFTHSRVLM